MVEPRMVLVDKLISVGSRNERGHERIGELPNAPGAKITQVPSRDR